MDEAQHCPSCGKQLEPNAPKGLCPACVLRAGLATGTETGSPESAQPKATAFVAPKVQELAPLFPQLEILEFLGQGGMGAVYKARQRELDRLVALKILPPRGRSDPSFAGRFTREARALAKLSHPNVVAVYDFGQTNGLPYFIMEYIAGPNLRQIERAGRLSSAETLRIIPQICEALRFAHEAGIVHRDIKPENILLEKSGRVKIADFGIAKVLGQPAEAAALTGVADVVGTPHYMAPEQIEHPQDVDHRADIYSLGVVFYEMLTGELPLGKFPPPSRKVGVDTRLDEVVFRTLEKAPEDRYQHATQVKTDLETIAAAPEQRPHAMVGEELGRAPAKQPAIFSGAKQPNLNRMKRKKVLFIVSCALTLLVVLLLVLLRPPQPPDIPLRFWAVAFSPDGKMLATVGGQSNPTEKPRLGELIFWDAATGKKKRTIREESSIRSVAWAPDGKFIAIGDFAGSTRLLSPGTGKLIATLPPHGGGEGGSVNAVAISADGKLVATGSLDGTVTLWDMVGKELEPLVLPAGEKAISISIAPDHGALVAGGRNGKAYLFDLEKRSEPRMLDSYPLTQKGRPTVETVAFAPDGSTIVTGSGKVLRLWDSATGKLLGDFNGSEASVEGLAFSPDGETLASVGSTGTLALWNPATRQRTGSTVAHVSDCFGVAFSRDGRRIATAGRRDFTAKVWDAQILALRATMHRAQQKPKPRP